MVDSACMKIYSYLWLDSLYEGLASHKGWWGADRGQNKGVRLVKKGS